jgi:hypothetical protein
LTTISRTVPISWQQSRCLGTSCYMASGGPHGKHRLLLSRIVLRCLATDVLLLRALTPAGMPSIGSIRHSIKCI